MKSHMNVKSVKRNYDLTNHKRVHTGEKLYLCDLCKKSYAQRNALSRHNKTATHIEKIKSRN